MRWSAVPTGADLRRHFDAAMKVRENLAGDALASIIPLQWNTPSKAWTGGAAMADASLNKRMTVRFGPGIAFAQIGIVGFDGQIEVEALRLYDLPEAAPALLCGTPALPVGQREFAVEVAWDPPNLAPGAASLLDVTVAGARHGDLVHAALISSTRFIELDVAAWANNTVRVMVRNISPTAAFDLGSATLSVQGDEATYALSRMADAVPSPPHPPPSMRPTCWAPAGSPPFPPQPSIRLPVRRLRRSPCLRLRGPIDEDHNGGTAAWSRPTRRDLLFGE